VATFFSGLEGGDYIITQTNKQDYYDVSDGDRGSDLCKITISGVRGGLECTENDFVDELLLAIKGDVKEDTNNDDIGDTNVANVTIRLLDKNKVLLKTTTTDISGNYNFPNIAPDQYCTLWPRRI
jgi:hypothetical protein